MLEGTSQEKSLIHQEYACFSMLLSEYGEPHNFKEEECHEYPEELEV